MSSADRLPPLKSQEQIDRETRASARIGCLALCTAFAWGVFAGFLLALLFA